MNVTHKFLLTLLLIDIIFVITDIVAHYIVYTNPSIIGSEYMYHFYVTSDQWYAEWFQHIKYILVICVIIILSIYKKDKLFLFWIPLFLMFLLDDALMIHEHSAVLLTKYFDMTYFYGLSTQAFSALLFFALLGLSFMIPVLLSFYIGNKKLKNTCIDIFLLFVPFLFFVIVVDVFYGVFRRYEYLRYALGVFEDGGEMLAFSFMTWYFLFIIYRPTEHDKFLYQYFIKKLNFNSEK